MGKKAYSIPGPGPKPPEPKYFAKAPIREMMKDLGCKIVSQNALLRLIEYLEKNAAVIVKNAIEITKSDKKKKLTAKDIRKATR